MPRTKTKYSCNHPDCSVMIGNEMSMDLNEDGSVKPLRAMPVRGGPKCDKNCKDCEYSKKYEEKEYPDAIIGGKEIYDDYEERLLDYEEVFKIDPSSVSKQCTCLNSMFYFGFGAGLKILLKCSKCGNEYSFYEG